MLIHKLHGMTHAVEIFDLKEDDINISLIAHSLGNKCRWNGHCPKFYSVAEHCVKGAELFGDDEQAMQFLLHDAYEAYVSDIVKPLKKHIYVDHKNDFGSISEKEEEGIKRIYKRFGISYPPDITIKEVDNGMTCLEECTFFSTERIIPIMSESIYQIVEDYISFEYWTPEEAKSEYISKFNSLAK